MAWLACAALCLFYASFPILLYGRGLEELSLIFTVWSVTFLMPFVASWPIVARAVPRLERSLITSLVVVQVIHAVLVVLVLVFGPFRSGPHDMGLGFGLAFLALEASVPIGFIMPRLLVPALRLGRFVDEAA